MTKRQIRYKQFTVLSSLVLASCSGRVDEPARPNVSTGGPHLALARLLGPESDSALSLKTELLRDTIAVGEPVRILYTIVNPYRPRPFVNDPDNYEFVVETETGRVIAPTYSQGSMTRNWGQRVLLTLPAPSILGQVVDLTCMHAPYSEKRPRACEWGFAFKEPGDYRVITRYKFGDARLPMTTEPILLADTSALVVRQ
jgi:hypothetical protein